MIPQYLMVFTFDDPEQAAAFWTGLSVEQRRNVRRTRMLRTDEIRLHAQPEAVDR